MRLDKFLKLSRIIKRRTLAKEIADQGRVTINGNQAKAASRVVIGDKLSIQFGQKIVTIEVLDIKENVKKSEAESMYRVIQEEKISE
ncbi:ribosomal 50S subunit-recycling heat shock protein [Cerasibacillus quisquiliarum]|uniref:RQC P-site tRNA stabilizing factor n=1 Tax=Cerasibacillus quisquiliarum TaxID=227865 RepID=A0A511UXB9_9BACI|nr:RNA-binding S4 domain-containing protein [Cerasibacillus quisquiliarum]MBB5146586.1 ribosomal 50S subunit-recycling heat shock protein [Cerasibacillus quisquiliarum]GEN31285.1 hypothetical protein CQU01_15230 [Cerasibacillus quisquiliarum]